MSSPSSKSSAPARTGAIKKLLAFLLAVLAVIVIVRLWAGIGERLAPEPSGALVAVEAEGTGVAVVGPMDLEVGEGFTLRAVLTATARDGSTVYYTDADALEVGGERVDPEALLDWDRADEARVLWFSVEGLPRYLEASGPEDLARLDFHDILRPEWSQAWSVPGVLERDRAVELPAGVRPFGRQRYSVAIEIFGPESRIVPKARFSSPGAAAVNAGDAGSVPRVAVALPEPLTEAGSVFGLAQVELAPGLDPATAASLGAEIADWFSEGRAFSRLLVLRRHLAPTGVGFDGLAWRSIDLDDGPPWDGAEGDIVRVGQRWVIVFEDRGGPDGREGFLDGSDLCLDYDRGPAVRRLDDVFIGDGLVEWAPDGGAG